MARVALKDFASRKTTCLCFFQPSYDFPTYFRVKKKRIEILRRSVQFQPMNSDLKPFRIFLDDVGTPLKLKSAFDTK